MRKEFEMNTKEREVAISYIENNDNDFVKELGIRKTSHSRWRKELEDHEFEHYFGLGSPEIKELKHENICLQKMINDAKKEQALLKKAISALFV